MAKIKLIRPSTDNEVRSVFCAWGTCDADILCVTGKLTHNGDVRFGKTLRGPRHNIWVVVFGLPDFGGPLPVFQNHDLEILDHTWTCRASAANLQVIGAEQNLQIDYPTNGAQICNNFMADGTTDGDTEPIRCRKMSDGTIGTEMYRSNGFWGIEFLNVTEASGQTLDIYHPVNCQTNGQTVSNLNVHGNHC